MMRLSTTLLKLFVCSTSLLMFGCNVDGEFEGFDTLDEERNSSSIAAIDLDEFDLEVIDRVLAREHNSDSFVKINAEPYPTTLNTTQNIELYVDAENAESYSQIDPDNSGSFQELKEGAFIVREVWEEGRLVKYTVMVKREPGYFPDTGDFYYAVFDAVGNVEQTDDGELKAGALDACAVCHIPRADDGYLFGVPLYEQAELKVESSSHN